MTRGRRWPKRRAGNALRYPRWPPMRPDPMCSSIGPLGVKPSRECVTPDVGWLPLIRGDAGHCWMSSYRERPKMLIRSRSWHKPLTADPARQEQSGRSARDFAPSHRGARQRSVPGIANGHCDLRVASHMAGHYHSGHDRSQIPTPSEQRCAAGGPKSSTVPRCRARVRRATLCGSTAVGAVELIDTLIHW